MKTTLKYALSIKRRAKSILHTYNTPPCLCVAMKYIIDNDKNQSYGFS